MIWDATHVEISAPHPQCTALTDTRGSMQFGTQLTFVWTDEERINLKTTSDRKQQQKATVHSQFPPSSSPFLLHLHDNDVWLKERNCAKKWWINPKRSQSSRGLKHTHTHVHIKVCNVLPWEVMELFQIHVPVVRFMFMLRSGPGATLGANVILKLLTEPSALSQRDSITQYNYGRAVNLKTFIPTRNVRD